MYVFLKAKAAIDFSTMTGLYLAIFMLTMVIAPLIIRVAQRLGLIVGKARLNRILNAIQKENPDMLVSTGDLIDGQIDDLSRFAEIFKEIRPKYGKYAITGNHEFYAGFNNALAFTEEAGFTILRDESLTVAGIINIAGVDDQAGEHYGLVKDISEVELLKRLPRDKFTLLLKHRPIVNEETLGLFDLQLSGHVHRGQIFPFSMLTKLYYPLQAGLEKLQKGSCIYISRGAGTWGPPIRFLSPPEVTFIELFHWDGIRC